MAIRAGVDCETCAQYEANAGETRTRNNRPVRWTQDAVEWEALISESFVPLSLASVERDFTGGIGSVFFGDGASVHRVASSGSRLKRKFTGASSQEGLLLYLQRRGRGRVDQLRRSAEHGPGEATAYLTQEPYELVFPEASDGIVVQVPVERLTADHDDVRRLTARTFPAQPALRGLIAYASELIAGDPPRAEDLVLLGETVTYLVDSTLVSLGAPHRGDPASAIRVRYARFVRRHACEPATSVVGAAEAMSVSVRSLYAAFEGTRETPSEMLRRRRVALASAALANTSLSISEVALRSGFSDVGTFHRAFKKHVGVSPRQYRVGTASPPASASTMRTAKVSVDTVDRVAPDRA